MAPRNPWFDLSLNAMKLGLESQTVIALRMMQASVGGPKAQQELSLMVSEKIQACFEVSGQMMGAGLDVLGPGPSSRAVTHMRRKVRANRRRLLKGD
jgi:hypothetical protein